MVIVGHHCVDLVSQHRIFQHADALVTRVSKFQKKKVKVTNSEDNFMSLAATSLPQPARASRVRCHVGTETSSLYLAAW